MSSSEPSPTRRILKLTAIVVGLVLAGLVLLVLVRTWLFESKQIDVEPAPSIEHDGEAAAERLAGAVRFATISHSDPEDFDEEAFLGLHDYLETSFPKVHARLEREVVGELSLLYTWTGSDPSLDPLVLMGHLDVVPIEDGTRADWTHDPFGGAIADGWVWGRGTMDDKLAVLGTLEAVEYLLAQGIEPERTVMLAFGHDEEVGGANGMRRIVELVRERGIAPWLVMDEGLVIADGMMPGVEAPVALLGLAEKGYLSVELTATTEGGHSSMPPKETAVGVIGRAVARLEDNPMPASLDGVVGQMFDHVGPEMGFGKRLVFANLWLFEPLVENQLEKKPATNALMRTTTAPTIVRGGVQENVLPSTARAVVNFRIRPGDTVDDVVEHVESVVDDDRVEVKALGGLEGNPSPVSSTDSDAFETVHRTVREVFPDVIVAPGLVLGATDSRYWAGVAGDVYRFLPMRLVNEDLARIHGTDERLSVENYGEIVHFYVRLIENAAGE